MKRLLFSIASLLFAASIAYGVNAIAQTTRASTFEGPAIPFRLVVLGTRYYADVDVLLRNLRELPPVEQLVPRLESQNRLEFDGRFRGPPPSLVADVRSLAANRFEVAQAQEGKLLLLTLRKSAAPIAPLAPPPPAETTVD